MINNYLAIGQETLSSLMSQRDRLKGVQKKTLDMLNYLGISNSLMRSVERRDNVDKWIVYIGMILILLLVFYLLFWRKS
jgi:Golgi SNAP receptor complex protein 2